VRGRPSGDAARPGAHVRDSFLGDAAARAGAHVCVNFFKLSC
jgi:hypothetical protein